LERKAKEDERSKWRREAYEYKRRHGEVQEEVGQEDVQRRMEKGNGRKPALLSLSISLPTIGPTHDIFCQPFIPHVSTLALSSSLSLGWRDQN